MESRDKRELKANETSPLEGHTCSSIQAGACRGEWMEPSSRPVHWLLRPQLWSRDWPRNRSPERISKVTVTKTTGERLPREATQTKKRVEDATLGSFPSEKCYKRDDVKKQVRGTIQKPRGLQGGWASNQRRSTCRCKCAHTLPHHADTHTRMNMPCTRMQICTCMPMPT